MILSIDDDMLNLLVNDAIDFIRLDYAGFPINIVKVVENASSDTVTRS